MGTTVSFAKWIPLGTSGFGSGLSCYNEYLVYKKYVLAASGIIKNSTTTRNIYCYLMSIVLLSAFAVGYWNDLGIWTDVDIWAD